MLAEVFLFIFHMLPLSLLSRFKELGRQTWIREVRSSQGETQKVEEPGPTDPKAQYTYQKMQLGIWELVYISRSRFSKMSWFQSAFLKNVHLIQEHWPVVLRFMEETYEIAPRETMCYLLHNFWNSLQGSLSLYTTSKLIDLVSYESSILPCILAYNLHPRSDRV